MGESGLVLAERGVSVVVGENHPVKKDINKNMDNKNQSEAKHKRAGRVFSEEHKARLSAAKKGKKQSPEHVQKRVEATRKTVSERIIIRDNSKQT